MVLLILSFVAGILTVLAPCILPLLPVIVGGSVLSSGDEKEKSINWFRPVVIAGSLVISVVLFTLLLKASTTFLGVPQWVWQIISGVIVILLGFSFLFPKAWEHIPVVNSLNIGSNTFLGKSYGKQGISGEILIGAALGPVFSSCSPTYALVVATVLPASFLQGLVYLLAYAFGLAGTLLIIAYAGQAVVNKLGWLSNPSGWFKRLIGTVFIVVGLTVVFGIDKKIQTFVLDKGWYDPIAELEQSMR